MAVRKELLIALVFVTAADLVAVFVLSQCQSPPPVVAVPGVMPPAFHSPLPAQPSEPPRPLEPEFVEVPSYRTVGESDSVYADVLSHSRGATFGDGHGRSTNVHETAHGIHAEVRNKYIQQLGRKVNAFYVLGGRAVVVDEPKIRKSAVNRFVPESLRSYRYGTYLTGQREWDDTPLYLFDEWNACVLGGMCCVDDVQKGRHRGGWTDGVSGCLDFSIYATCLCMAVRDGDPAYWKANTQFRRFVDWNLRRAESTYALGSKMEQFKWDRQDKLLAELRGGAAAEPVRKFLLEEFGGVWLDPAKSH